jgi:hypothetical protein
MFKGLSKVFLLSAMLIAYLGQSIAYSNNITCDAPSDNQIDKVSNVKSDHFFSQNLVSATLVKSNSAQHTDSERAIDCCDVECCDIDCVCFGNACSHFSYLQITLATTNIVINNEALYWQKNEPKQSLSQLLYRPPIFIS